MKTTVDKGSAHAVVIVILVLALLGTLGFVFWQNFIKKDDTAKTSDTSKQTSDETAKPADVYAGWQTYTSKQHGISFRYPANWKVDPTEATTEGYYSLHVALTERGKQSARFAIGVNPQGLGGTGQPTTYSVLHSEKIALPASKDTYITFLAVASVSDEGKPTGKYHVMAGITDDPAYYESKGKVAGYTLIYLTAALKSKDASTLFVTNPGYGDEFNSHDDVEKYYQSSEYQQTLNILLSIKIAA